MQIHAKTDKGKVRATNQDSVYINTLSGGAAFAIVCDGMGGANAGDIASKTAVEIISNYVTNSYSPVMNSDETVKLITNAVVSANIEIFDMSQKNDSLKGMGTTAVIAVARDDYAVICNVGDSRAYLINGELKQITRDHSMVQSLVESGKLLPEQAVNHPEKNVITRALGVEENVIADSYVIDFNDGDKILLCTDGMSNFVSGETILKTVKDNEIDKATDLLIDEANFGGGKDNITVALISH